MVDIAVRKNSLRQDWLGLQLSSFGLSSLLLLLFAATRPHAPRQPSVDSQHTQNGTRPSPHKEHPDPVCPNLPEGGAPPEHADARHGGHHSASRQCPKPGAPGHNPFRHQGGAHQRHLCRESWQGVPDGGAHRGVVRKRQSAPPRPGEGRDGPRKTPLRERKQRHAGREGAQYLFFCGVRLRGHDLRGDAGTVQYESHHEPQREGHLVPCHNSRPETRRAGRCKRPREEKRRLAQQQRPVGGEDGGPICLFAGDAVRVSDVAHPAVTVPRPVRVEVREHVHLFQLPQVYC
mmetsp:Transcript_12591/g.25181  ORF Transcript_12591/g.25181 Transcript_12591/m.25181 type:complete len:290 (+) Transcript_12591:240-1109(+)